MHDVVQDRDGGGGRVGDEPRRVERLVRVHASIVIDAVDGIARVGVKIGEDPRGGARGVVARADHLERGDERASRGALTKPSEQGRERASVSIRRVGGVPLALGIQRRLRGGRHRGERLEHLRRRRLVQATNREHGHERVRDGGARGGAAEERTEPFQNREFATGGARRRRRGFALFAAARRASRQRRLKRLEKRRRVFAKQHGRDVFVAILALASERGEFGVLRLFDERFGDVERRRARDGRRARRAQRAPRLRHEIRSLRTALVRGQ